MTRQELLEQLHQVNAAIEQGKTPDMDKLIDDVETDGVLDVQCDVELAAKMQLPRSEDEVICVLVSRFIDDEVVQALVSQQIERMEFPFDITEAMTEEQLDHVLTQETFIRLRILAKMSTLVSYV